MSANLLTWIGLPYVSEGGSPFLKMHPASLLCLAALVLSRPHLIGPMRNERGDAWTTALPAFYVICLCFCLVSEFLLTGTGSLIVLLDSFLPAGLLSLAFADVNVKQQLQLQAVLRTGVLVNALIAVAESMLHATLIPLNPGSASDLLLRSGFRPFAFYDHPLTGAAVTMTGMFLPPGMDWGPMRKTLYFVALGFGLLAFAERSAIIAAALIAAAASAPLVIRYVLQRGDFYRGVLLLSGLLLLASACGLGAYAAGLGGRLGEHLYWDASARVRLRQWDILNLLDAQQLLFGISRQGALALLEPMRIRFGVPLVENSWLLLFMSLGLFGSAFFVFGWSAFLLWCVERGRGRGLAMTTGLLAMASSSNALGRKSILLIIVTTAIASLPRVRGEDANPAPHVR